MNEQEKREKLSEAALSQGQAGQLSSRYSFIPTTKVLDVFHAEGWNLVSSKAVKSRDKTKAQYAKHCIELDHPELSALSDGERFRITLVNAHDGSSSFRFYLGVFRMVCENGLCVGQGMEYRVRHVGFTQAKVSAVIKEAIAQAPKVAAMMNRMKNTELSPLGQTNFQIQAAQQINQKVTAEQLNATRRQADHGRDLWTVFNKAQEHVVKGGLRYLTTTAKGNPSIRRTRGIQAIQKQIKTNRALWDLAVEFANAA